MGQVGGNGRGSGFDEPFRPRISIQDAAAKLKGRIEKDREGRDVIRCPGPNHGKDDASLSVWLDEDEPGGIGVHSFSGRDDGDPLALKDWVRRELGLPDWKPAPKGSNGHDRDPITAKYQYDGADGSPVLLVNRTKAKKFLQQKPDGSGGWAWGGIADKLKVPYRLPELIEAIGLGKTIYVVEGEKSADALTARGYASTCSPGGAGKWPEHFAQHFQSADVLILADNDIPGRKHADRVLASLEPVAGSVRIIHIPGLIAGGDVWDYLAAGGDPERIATMRSGPPARGHMATELWGMQFPPINYAVPVYIAEGLTLLAGAPKRGKSWLALDVCVAVARGGLTLGDQKCVEGDTLYAALEDSPRRMKSRLNIVCQLAKQAPSRLTVWFGSDLPRLGQGCEEALREWIDSVPNPRLIVIDTLNYIRPERTRDEDPYSYDYRSATTLQRLAGEFGIAIVLIHHTRKSAADDYLESISGTNGLTGGCDAVVVLDRQGDGSTVLKGRGRDIEEFEVAMKFEKEDCRWHVLGDAAEARQSDVRTRILRHLREAGWMLTAAEIASQTGLRKNTVEVNLFRMFKAGDVCRIGRGKYGLPDVVVDGGKDPED
jgi:AAA domain-containing protein